MRLHEASVEEQRNSLCETAEERPFRAV